MANAGKHDSFNLDHSFNALNGRLKLRNNKMSTKYNDERLEDLQVFLGEHNLTLDNIRFSPTQGYYAFKDVDDDEGQTMAVKVYMFPQDIKDTLNLIRNIEVEEISENTQDYPVTTI